MPRASERPRFLVDAMLGDVARWLRILGEDAAWAPPEWPDDELLARAAREARVLVTRDARLTERAVKRGLSCLAVPQAPTPEVLFGVYDALALAPEATRLATRCATCNGPLDAVGGAEAAARARQAGRAEPLPEVRARHEAFWSCRECGQAYWRGTHWDTIEALRERLVARLR